MDSPTIELLYWVVTPLVSTLHWWPNKDSHRGLWFFVCKGRFMAPLFNPQPSFINDLPNMLILPSFSRWNITHPTGHSPLGQALGHLPQAVSEDGLAELRCAKLLLRDGWLEVGHGKSKNGRVQWMATDRCFYGEFDGFMDLLWFNMGFLWIYYGLVWFLGMMTG